MTGRDIWGLAREGRIPLGVSTFAIGILLLAPALSVAAPASVVRIGGPSAPKDAKVAIVAGPAALRGSRFAVTLGGKTVLRGRLRPTPGRSAPWPSAFRADLSALRKPGAYRIHVAGRASRRWLVSERGSELLVPLILRFFAANRDGSLPALLHGPAHLHDATVAGSRRHIDLTGGWMDAGDMLHFTQTTAYATMVLEAAARLDPTYRAQLEEEAGVGIAWLLKAHPTPGLFITQVGDDRDHRRDFTNPAGDDSSGLPGIANRVAYHWGLRVGGDIGGKVAAALAMAAIRSPDPTRSQLIEQAREWYAAGKASGRSTPALHGAGGFYVVAGWRDSLAAGAAALYRATDEGHYLKAAHAYLTRSDPQSVLGYFNAAPLAAADICGRLGAPALGSRPARRQACRFLRRNGRWVARLAHRDAFGLAGPATWGTTSSNGAGGAIAAVSGHRPIAVGARDYLLGRNPWGASFVAGFGPHNPRAVSSWASVFGPGQPVGAVVGGPAPRRAIHAQGFQPGGPLRHFNSGIAYEDRRRDYVTSEPALDYAANSILLLAALQGTERALRPARVEPGSIQPR